MFPPPLLCGGLPLRRLVSLEPFGSVDVSTSDERRTELGNLSEHPLSQLRVSRSRPVLWYSGGVIWSNPTVTPPPGLLPIRRSLFSDTVARSTTPYNQYEFLSFLSFYIPVFSWLVPSSGLFFFFQSTKETPFQRFCPCTPASDLEVRVGTIIYQ